MDKLVKVNWVICPNCKYRYYVGASLLMAEGVPAVCPKCHHEFDPKLSLEPKFDATQATWT